MGRKEKKKIWKRTVEVHKMEWLYPYVRLEDFMKVCKELEEENKKLNIKVASLEWEIKWLNSTIEKLKEENQTLELWLDRKEKLNEKYRKELKNYVYDAKQVRDIC
jgi:predicted RNase H-like nuclease (RuvC/YqgF family)